MRDYARRMLPRVIAFGFAMGGFCFGILVFFFLGLWLKSGFEQIGRLAQEPLSAHFWLAIISGVIGGSLGLVFGAVLGILFLRKIHLLTEGEVRKFLATGHM